ncbi:MAG: CBM96 family carbohydrate-binding protein [Angustibacter sp.]
MHKTPTGRHRAPSSDAPASAHATTDVLPPRHLGQPVRVATVPRGLVLLVVGALAAVLLPGGGLASSLTAAGPTRTLTFRAVADTYIAQRGPGMVLGRSTKLVAGSASTGGTKLTLVRFKISGIPAGATNVKARLVLRRDEHHLPTTTVTASAAAPRWDERVSWRSRPRIGSKVGAVTAARSTNVVTIALKSVARSGDVAFAISSSARGDVARFRSRESGSAPLLQVTYTAPVTTSVKPPVRPTPSTTTTAPTTPPTVSPTSTSTATPSSTTSATSTTTTASPSSTSQPPTGTCRLDAKLVPSCGMLWGVAPGAYTDQARTDALIDYEKTVNRRMDIFHAYHKDDQLFPTAAERAISTDPANPRMLLMNWKPSTTQTWRQVADGAADARIDRLASYIRSTYDRKLFMTIWHEPENDVNPTAGSGMTAQDYHDMFRHVVQRLRADGLSQAVFVVNYQSYPQYAEQDWWPQLYPGNDVVDWIAWDAYNYGLTSGYNSGDFLATINRVRGAWQGFYAWAHANHPDKPLMLAEWGIYQRDTAPGRQSWYFDDVRAHLADAPQIKAMVYFDSPMVPSLGATQAGPDALPALKSLLASTRAVSF